MPTLPPPALVLLAAFALTGCTQFPELDATITAEGMAAPEPVLVDNRRILSAAEAGTVDQTTQAALQSRAAALQGRSAVLAAPVIQPSDRASIDATHLRLRSEAARVAPDGGTR